MSASANDLRIFKSLRRRTQRALETDESKRFEFKAIHNDVRPEDFVAFANSREGGVILIGVEDARKGALVVSVSSAANMVTSPASLSLNKAKSCRPPISVEFSVENAQHKALLVVDIAASPTGPHCAEAGVYKIRGMGGNLPYTPDRLLQRFLEQDAERYADAFEKIAQKTEERLDELADHVGERLSQLQAELTVAAGKIDSIGAVAEDAWTFSQETHANTEEITEQLGEFERDLYGRLRQSENAVSALEPKLDLCLTKLGVMNIEHELLRSHQRLVAIGLAMGELKETKSCTSDQIRKELEAHANIWGSLELSSSTLTWRSRSLENI